MDNWTKFEKVSGLIMPVVLALVGYWVTSAINRSTQASADAQNLRTTAVQYVDLATTILKAPPTSEDKELRAWAVQLINKYADVKLSIALGNSLTTTTAIPSPSQSNWSTTPNSAYCYQERDKNKAATAPDHEYLVHCHWSQERCETTRGPNKTAGVSQSGCVLVDLREATWNPVRGGYAGAWYQFSATPFGPPFPQL